MDDDQEQQEICTEAQEKKIIELTSLVNGLAIMHRSMMVILKEHQIEIEELKSIEYAGSEESAEKALANIVEKKEGKPETNRKMLDEKILESMRSEIQVCIKFGSRYWLKETQETGDQCTNWEGLENKKHVCSTCKYMHSVLPN